MGSSHSCLGGPRVPGKNVFAWKIDGFTSLLKQGEGSINTGFDMDGIGWQLSLNPLDKRTGDTSSKRHVSVGIAASPSFLRPNYMLQTKFRVFIYDQKNGNHIVKEVNHTYLTTSRASGVSCMVPLETLQNPSFGFLVNNTIAIGLELIQLKRLACNGIERSSFIQKKTLSGSHSWYIDDFFQLKKPSVFSEPFQVGGYTWYVMKPPLPQLCWRLKLQPKGVGNKNYLSLYLKLDRSRSQLPPSEGVMVDLVLSIKKQPTGTYKGRDRYNFSPRARGWGYAEFIRVEEFMDPKNGYLIKGTCTFEASVTILGSANDRA